MKARNSSLDSATDATRISPDRINFDATKAIGVNKSIPYYLVE